jgi:acetyltransferase-like isoleucine patch superfamily enzyme
VGSYAALFDNVSISGVGIVRIGDHSSIGHDTVIVARESVRVGDRTMIAGYCYILDVDHDFRSVGTPIVEQGLRVEPVVIGNDVWIGAHTVILRGVSIGNGAVVGANSVVTRNVPALAVVAGNPADVLRFRTGR